jgi:hypothetical protein
VDFRSEASVFVCFSMFRCICDVVCVAESGVFGSGPSRGGGYGVVCRRFQGTK